MGFGKLFPKRSWKKKVLPLKKSSCCVVCLQHWNLPVWIHWILNVQSFTPRFKPVYVVSHLTPELLGVVSRRGESSAVSRVGCIVSAGVRGEILVEVCRRKRSCCPFATLLCSRNSPQLPPECPLALKGGAVTQAQKVFYLEVHCGCSDSKKVNFQAFLPLPLCSCRWETRFCCSTRSDVISGATWRGRSFLQKTFSLQPPQGMWTNWPLLMQDEGWLCEPSQNMNKNMWHTKRCWAKKSSKLRFWGSALDL